MKIKNIFLKVEPDDILIYNTIENYNKVSKEVKVLSIEEHSTGQYVEITYLNSGEIDWVINKYDKYRSNRFSPSFSKKIKS